MKALNSLLIAIIFFSCSSSNQVLFEDNSFEQEPIASLLSVGAHSVVRNSETKVEIKSESEAYLTVKKATTIFKKENKDAASLVLSFSPLREIEYIKANLIDKNGNIIRSFDESDAIESAAFDGFSFFSDSRIKALDFNYSSFPYTVEVEYRLKYNGVLFLPTWYPQLPGQGVQKASLEVQDYTKGVRYHTKNIEGIPVENNVLGAQNLKWEVALLTAKEREPYGPPVQEILPSVVLAPSRFEIENTRGDASNWKDFGKWYYSLGQGTRKLSSEAIREVEEVIDGISTESEKIKALYNYLQDKTRYVSIQLGIGGWKPFSADYVFENEYGDCKALTNYMQAILEHIGVKSNPVLIRRGISEPAIISEFSSNQFNHVLLRVELDNGDILWLECTSKYFAPGHIGSGNEDRDALMISKEGGEIIRTPMSLPSENISSSISKIEISESGKVIMSTTQTNTGVLQESVQYRLLPISDAAKIEWLENSISASNFDVMEADFSGIRNDTKDVSYSYTLDFSNYTTTSSSRIFVPLETINSWSFNPDKEVKRKQEIWLPYVLTEKDQSIYVLPKNYDIEAIPEEAFFQSEFANYSIEYTINEEGNLLLKRELVINEKRIPPEAYNDFREFFMNVSKSDSKQLVLVKKKT
ncbi:MAG: DUF3857 domain-containing protein [Balneola sp.]